MVYLNMKRWDEEGITHRLPSSIGAVVQVKWNNREILLIQNYKELRERTKNKNLVPC